MDCRLFSEPLDLAPGLDSDDPRFAEALRHTRQCRDCADKLARRLARERVVRGVMKEMAPPPPSLYRAVVRGRRKNPPPVRRLAIYISMLAASIFLAVGISLPAYKYWRTNQRMTAVHKLCVLSIKNHEVTPAPEYTAYDKAKVNKWLTNRMGRLVKLPDTLNLQNRAISARRAVLGEHTVAAVEFKIDGKRSTVFSFYPRQYGVSGKVMEPPKYEMGYTVAFWNENGLGYSLVSEASPKRVRAVFHPGARF